MTGALDWIAVDCGPARTRLWALSAEGEVLDKAEHPAARSPDAVARLVRRFGPEAADLRSVPVLVCGIEDPEVVPARQVPCATPGPEALIRPALADGRLDLWLVPGLKQENPAALACGAETRIAGILAASPNFDGVICVPGARTVWAQVSAKEVVSFVTFMTGQLFGIVADQSGLTGDPDEREQAAFLDAVGDVMSRPAGLAAELEALRSARVLGNTTVSSGRARLSGLLVGAELAAARPYWLGQEVIVSGDSALSDAYAGALVAQGVQPRRIGADETVIAGLAMLRLKLRD